MNQFLPHKLQNTRNHGKNRRRSLPSLTSYSVINTSLTTINEEVPLQPPAPQISKRKFSVEAFHFSTIDYFSTSNLPKSISNVNIAPLAPIKTGGAFLATTTNFDESFVDSGANEDANEQYQSSTDIIKEEDDEETDDDDLNQGFICEDKDVDLSHVFNAIRKSILQRRESLPTFLSINPITAAASGNNERKQRRNSIDVVRSQKPMNRYPTKRNDDLNKAFVNDKENDILEYYDKIIEEDETIVLDDVFEVEEERYERILYLPKAVPDKDIDYKKKYLQLLQRYQKREERIVDVKRMILDGKRKSEVLQRLNGILAFKPPVDRVKKDVVEKDTVAFLQKDQQHIVSPTPEKSNTVDDLEKEFERLKMNVEEEKITKDSYKNITEEYLEKFSNEESQRRSLQIQLYEKNEEIEALKAQLAAAERS